MSKVTDFSLDFSVDFDIDDITLDNDLGNQNEDIDLDIGSSKESSIDEINALLAELDNIDKEGSLPKVDDNSLDSFMEYEESIIADPVQVFPQESPPDNCILWGVVDTDVAIYIIKGIADYFEENTSEHSQMIAKMAIENSELPGEYIVANNQFEINAELVTTLIELSKLTGTKVRIKLSDKIYNLFDTELLNLLICS